MSKLNDLLFTPVCEIDQNNPDVRRACKLMVRTRPYYFAYSSDSVLLDDDIPVWHFWLDLDDLCAIIVNSLDREVKIR